jgi:hypothetical protein
LRPLSEVPESFFKIDLLDPTGRSPEEKRYSAFHDSPQNWCRSSNFKYLSIEQNPFQTEPDTVFSNLFVYLHGPDELWFCATHFDGITSFPWNRPICHSQSAASSDCWSCPKPRSKFQQCLERSHFLKLLQENGSFVFAKTQKQSNASFATGFHLSHVSSDDNNEGPRRRSFGPQVVPKQSLDGQFESKKAVHSFEIES